MMRKFIIYISFLGFLIVELIGLINNLSIFDLFFKSIATYLIILLCGNLFCTFIEKYASISKDIPKNIDIVLDDNKAAIEPNTNLEKLVKDKPASAARVIEKMINEGQK